MRLSTNQGHLGRRGTAAFTLIEIALSVAVVAFALVAIIGILPMGMEVQKDNREDTIINQEGPFHLEAMLNASTNLGTLHTNLEWIELHVDGVFAWRAYASSTNLDSRRLLGIMCRPKYETNSTSVTTNELYLKVRANSGPLSLESTNTRDLAFSYILKCEVIPFTVSTYGADAAVSAAMRTNTWEVRLLYRWPVLRDVTNNVTTGVGRREFRRLVSARLYEENDASGSLWFFTPGSYVAY